MKRNQAMGQSKPRVGRFSRARSAFQLAARHRNTTKGMVEMATAVEAASEKFMRGIKVLMAKNYIDNLSEEARKGEARRSTRAAGRGGRGGGRTLSHRRTSTLPRHQPGRV